MESLESKVFYKVMYPPAYRINKKLDGVLTIEGHLLNKFDDVYLELNQFGLRIDNKFILNESHIELLEYMGYISIYKKKLSTL